MPMPTIETGFTTPTLSTLIQREDGDFSSQLGVDAFVPGSDAWVYARVLSGAMFLQYGFQSAILRELFPETCTAENLVYHGARWQTPRNEPTQSTMTTLVTFTGAETIPAGTLMSRSDGFEYLTDAALVAAGAGTASVNVTSIEKGANTLADVGTTLTFTSALVNVQSNTTVTAVDTEGVDLEDVEVWRARILARIGHVPQGGSLDDYYDWVGNIDGVEQCWVDSPSLGGVRAVFVGSAAEGDIEDSIDLLRPVTVTFTAVEADELAVAFDVDVMVLDGYTTAEVEANLQSSIEALIETETAPSTTIRNSSLRAALDNALGVDYIVLNNVILGSLV